MTYFNNMSVQTGWGNTVLVSYFSMKTYIVGTHQKLLTKMLLMSSVLTTYVFVEK